MWRQSTAMAMPSASPSLAETLAFTLQWGVMMAAMMLPSAMPMILLYRTVRKGLAAYDARAIPLLAFAAVYLLMWLLIGVPVYVLSLPLRDLDALPYLISLVLMIAGLYQFTPWKRACLRACESPMDFLMRRWRSGYLATFLIAVQHGSFCIGCCWALMVVLIAAGGMSMPWVLAISLVVFAEKIFPRGLLTAYAVGIVLIAAGLAIAIEPEWAMLLRPPMKMEM